MTPPAAHDVREPAASADAQRQAARHAGVLMGLLLAMGLLIDVFALGLPFGQLRHVGAVFVITTVAFALGETVVVHVELGKNAHTVSLSELTLTASLFFVPLVQLPAARVLGGTVVLLLVRRQPPLKIAFNMCLWVLDVAAATSVFTLLHGGLHTGFEHLVVPAFAAAMTMAFVDSVAVNTVIAVTSHELVPGRALRFVTTCLMGAAACATGALVCIGAMAYQPWLLAPILLVAGLYLYGFHHFGLLRAQHDHVKVLYDFTGELSRTPHGERVVQTVLTRVREMLLAERAALYLHDSVTDMLSVTEAVEEHVSRTRLVDASEVPILLRNCLDDIAPTVIRATTRNHSIRSFLTEYGARDAVVAPIQGKHGLRGALVIANRLGDVNTFTDNDGLLLQTLASHSAAALANSRLVERLDHDSLHDSLTGLANRQKFQERLTSTLAAHDRSMAVLLMDLDRFKEVNDTLGHHHGDLLLQEIGRRLVRHIRGGDVLARLGGDEFAVLMTDLTAQEAIETANRLLVALRRPMRLQGVEMEVAASIGLVHIPLDNAGLAELDATQLLQRADVAMYCAKRDYTGVHVYHDELDGYSPRRLALASGLRAAIEQGQLRMRYQLQSRLTDKEMVGAEALVSWDHPVYGSVSPDDFIMIAEQTGLIRELTRFVLDESLSACAAWSSDGTPLSVSVNLSVRNLMEPDLIDVVASLLDKHRVPGKLLTLEITESHLMSDPARTAEVLRGIAALGVRLSIDDFGTGYSSLAYLKQLPVAEIKVDKSFVRDIAHDDDDAAIVEAIIQLAHTLRLEVVAEGVEDEESQERLAAMGCDLFQGYHLARPMRDQDFREWLSRRAHKARRLHAVPDPRAGTDPLRVGTGS